MAVASLRARPASRPYRRAANRRFSIGLSFLKKAASTDTRLMSRFTASSSRSMSWPKTSTRPSSRVSKPEMRRMRVLLPEPFAPRIPWIAPRSRRSETSSIARTGGLRRSTVKRLVTCSTRRAGLDAGGGVSGNRVFGGREGGGHGTLLAVAWWLGLRAGPRDPVHGTSRGPGVRGPRLGVGAGVRMPAQTKEPGPGGPRLGGRSWGSSPASYLLVGTPLPPTLPRADALRG